MIAVEQDVYAAKGYFLYMQIVREVRDTCDSKLHAASLSCVFENIIAVLPLYTII